MEAGRVGRTVFRFAEPDKAQRTRKNSQLRYLKLLRIVPDGEQNKVLAFVFAEVDTSTTTARNAGCAPAFSKGYAMKRRRFKQDTPLEDRLTTFAQELRAKALHLPPGSEKDDLLRRARQAETALHLDEWANSPGLQPPK